MQMETWQVKKLDTTQYRGDLEIPEGWEPFAAVGAWIWIRRVKDLTPEVK